MSKLQQAGDTIIEVLIAITITSLVLTGAFVSARQSMVGNRKSQERVEATKIAEEQLERLRELAAVPGNQFINGLPATTCITNASPWYAASTGLSSNFSDAAAHPTACTRTPVAGGVSYYPVIVRSGTPGSYTFKVHVQWDRLSGEGIDEATVAYRFNS